MKRDKVNNQQQLTDSFRFLLEAQIHLKDASCLLIKVHSFLQVYRLDQSGINKRKMVLDQKKRLPVWSLSLAEFPLS